MNREKAEVVLIAIKADLVRHDQSVWTNIDATPDYRYPDGSYVPGYGTPKIKETENQVINCGTTACFAGHTAFIFAPVGTKFFRENMRMPQSDRLITYEDFADEALEMTSTETTYMFSGHRTVDELQEYIEATDDQQSDILSTIYDED